MSGLVLTPNPAASAPPDRQGVDAPTTAGAVFGAQFANSTQEVLGERQREEQAYLGNIASKLRQRLPQPKGLFAADPYVTHNPRYDASYQDDEYDPVAIFRDVARARAADPKFMSDIPAKDFEGFRTWVQAQRQRRRDTNNTTLSRSRGAGQAIAGFAGGMVAGFGDPINMAAMGATGGAAGALSPIWRTMAREAGVNALTELVETPITASARAEFGEETTAGDVLGNVGMAFAGGAAFTGGLHIGGKAVGRALDATGLPAMLDRRAALLELGRADFDPGVTTAAAVDAQSPSLTGGMRIGPRMSDAEIVAAMDRHVPPELRTPDEAAAVHVLRRQAEIDAVNPFEAGPQGMDAHADALTAAIAKIDAVLNGDHATFAAADNGTPVATVRAGARPAAPVASVPRGAPPAGVNRDSTIAFVLNTLEGGARVVDNGEGAGTTKFGITAKNNPGVDVASLTEAQATRIARDKYWFRELDGAAPDVAAIAFDAGYVAGPAVGRRILKAAGGDAGRALELYRGYLNSLADRSPRHAKFKRGWNNRLDRLARFTGGEPGGEGRLLADGGDAPDDLTAYHNELAALDAESMAGAGAEFGELPHVDPAPVLKRGLFGGEDEWRVAQAHVDAEWRGDVVATPARLPDVPVRDARMPRDLPLLATFRADPVQKVKAYVEMRKHPDYKAAKGGDTASAVRVVRDLVRPDTLDAAAQQFGGARFVAVHAEEQAGRNKLPLALAERYAHHVGGVVDAEIVQAVRAHHTGAKAAHRMKSRAGFDGAVERGADYVLVDDVTVMGGTLAELAAHIQRGGGNVKGVVVLASDSRLHRLDPTPAQVRAIEERFGDTVRDEFGIEPRALTADEAYFVLGFKDADHLRAKLVEGGQTHGGRGNGGVAEERSAYLAEAARGFDDPRAAAAVAQSTTLLHDLVASPPPGDAQFAVKGLSGRDGTDAPLYQSAQAVLDELIADDAAFATLKACL